MNKSAKKPRNEEMYKAILKLQTVEEALNFFDDLCTVKEVSDMAKRLCAAKLLDGNAVYTEVNGRTGLSTATISRISRCLKWAPGSFIFCRSDLFQRLGGFSTELYASEEIDFSRRLKREVRRRKEGRVIILKNSIQKSM